MAQKDAKKVLDKMEMTMELLKQYTIISVSIFKVTFWSGIGEENENIYINFSPVELQHTCFFFNLSKM